MKGFTKSKPITQVWGEAAKRLGESVLSGQRKSENFRMDLQKSDKRKQVTNLLYSINTRFFEWIQQERMSVR